MGKSDFFLQFRDKNTTPAPYFTRKVMGGEGNPAEAQASEVRAPSVHTHTCTSMKTCLISRLHTNFEAPDLSELLGFQI